MHVVDRLLNAVPFYVHLYLSETVANNEKIHKRLTVHWKWKLSCPAFSGPPFSAKFCPPFSGPPFSAFWLQTKLSWSCIFQSSIFRQIWSSIFRSSIFHLLTFQLSWSCIFRSLLSHLLFFIGPHFSGPPFSVNQTVQFLVHSPLLALHYGIDSVETDSVAWSIHRNQSRTTCCRVYLARWSVALYSSFHLAPRRSYKTANQRLDAGWRHLTNQGSAGLNRQLIRSRINGLAIPAAAAAASEAAGQFVIKPGALVQLAMQHDGRCVVSFWSHVWPQRTEGFSIG